jgi:hypothetical protein
MKKFLETLSSFWNRLFADSDQLVGLYEATYQAVGQVYLDLLESILNKSVNDVVVFNKRYWKLLTINNTDIFDTADSTYPYGFYLDHLYSDINRLLNSVVVLDRVLERYTDFDLVDSVTKPDGTTVSALKFALDPFSSGTNAGPLDGFAWKFTPNKNVVLESGVDGTTNGTTFKTLDTAKFSAVHKTYTLKITYGNGSIDEVSITGFVSGNELSVSPAFSSAETRVKWEILNKNETQLAFWVDEGRVDINTLFNNFGSIVNVKKPSSAAYKELLRGIYLYYTKGPILSHIESVVNVLHDFPLIKTDGEILQKYESNIDSVHDRVITDKNVYLVPIGFVRQDIQDPLNIGKLQFRAFESLSSLAQVKDFTSDPFWWWNIVVPGELLGSGETNERLQSDPNPFKFTVGTPEYPVKVGDLGLQIGTKLIQRHSYLSVYTYIQFHLLGVLVNTYPALLTYDEILDILQQGKLPESYVYLQPYKNISETVSVSELLAYTPQVTPADETLPAHIQTLTVGGGWSVSMVYWYDTPTTIGVTVNPTPNRAIGQTPLVIGGEDPYSLSQTGTLDWPVQVTVI